MRILLDTGVLGELCHPRKAVSRPVVEWSERILATVSQKRSTKTRYLPLSTRHGCIPVTALLPASAGYSFAPSFSWRGK